MPAPSLSASEIAGAAARLYDFTRTMFRARRKVGLLENWHQETICEALERVYLGLTTRLIINVPPRSGKTEIAVKNFMAWTLGLEPDAEFIHASYSKRLATANAYDVRAIMQHETYREVFPWVALQDDSKAKDEFRTTEGGIVYATGADGTITGYGAGKVRHGFGGCFPAGTKVWTDRGLLPIGEIVRWRIPAQAWAFDYAGNMVLRRITGWHENPPNEIVEVKFSDGTRVECTPDHRFWTENRGWVRADLLCKNDRLPSVNSRIQCFDNININAKCRCCRLNPASVLAASPVSPIGERDIGLIPSQNSAQVSLGPAGINYLLPAGNRFPSVASPYLVDHCRRNPVPPRQSCGGYASAFVDSHGIHVRQDSRRVDFSLAERPMTLTVGNVGRTTVIPEVSDTVISGIPIGVADFSVGGPRPCECQHDKRVHESVADSRPQRQANAQMPAWHDIWLQDYARLEVGASGAFVGNCSGLTSDPPKVADGIRPFIAGHRTPVLVKFIRHEQSTFCLTVEQYHNFTIESGVLVKNCLIIDDPHKAGEAASDVMRKNVIDWYQNTIESRLNRPETPIIVIMQRLHEEDLSGFLLKGGTGEHWEHLVIPARDNDGRSFWPEKFPDSMLDRLETTSPYVFAGQYMQRPAPLGGGIFKDEWWRFLDVPPVTRFRVIYADTAQKTKEQNDYSVFQCWGQTLDHQMVLLDMVRGKWEAPELETMARAFWQKHMAAQNMGALRALKVEDKVSGTGLIQKLAREGIPVVPITRNIDKVTRAMDAAPYVQSGNVILMRNLAQLSDFLSEASVFPNGTHDDMIDAAMSAISDMSAPQAAPAVRAL